jgi:mannose-6-phosphate isomerase-like protein (cupin superfamily)
MTVAKMRILPGPPPAPDRLAVHPGRDWFTVLSGTARLHLGERVVVVEAGQAAQFSTMVPHAIVAQGGPVEILTVLDHDGERAHLHADEPAGERRVPAPADRPAPGRDGPDPTG